MLDQEFLKLLACPRCGGRLRPAETDLVFKLNEQIEQHQVANVAGITVHRVIDGGLICDCSRHLFPIRDQIPVLLMDESIPIA